VINGACHSNKSIDCQDFHIFFTPDFFYYKIYDFSNK
jgi:hypothetical protein